VKAWAALVVTLIQCVMLFATPIASCCGRSAPLKAETNKVDEECCPPGSHPPGQCPLHKQKTPRQSSNDCRMRCDAQDAPAMLVGVAGILTTSIAPLAPAPAFSFRVATHATLVSRADFPDAPPPKTL
jgi:hypothetical protein